MAASIAQFQLIPLYGGFRPIQESSWERNASAYLSSPVNRYAMPSVARWWNRFSSQGNLTSESSRRSMIFTSR